MDLIITSPPYGRIKEYSNNKLEIGHDQNIEEYHNSLAEVWEECIRVLRPGCRLVINIGDEFVKKSETEPYHIIPHSSLIISNILNNFKNQIHFNGTILWNKVTTSNTSGGGKVMGSVYTPRDGHFFVNYEHIMVFKKSGKGPKVGNTRKERSKFTLDQRREWFKDHWDMAPIRQNSHIAMFPVELPERAIKMYSFIGDTIMDPFLGSGTTMLAAMNSQRSCIGVELGFDNKVSWKEIIKEKLQTHKFSVEFK